MKQVGMTSAAKGPRFKNVSAFKLDVPAEWGGGSKRGRGAEGGVGGGKKPRGERTEERAGGGGEDGVPSTWISLADADGKENEESVWGNN